MSMGRTSLFVGDLAIFCTEMDLERAFSVYGQILEIKIMRSEESYRNLSYGFIKFALFECAREAMLALDGVILCGRPMRVRWATFKNKLNSKDMKPDGLETSPVHVSFLSYQILRLVTEQTLRALFGRYGEVVDVSIKKSVIDKDINRQSGYGFVHYSINPDGVQAAVVAAQNLHDTTIDDVNYKTSISHSLNKFLVEDMGIPQSTLPPPAPSIFSNSHSNNHVPQSYRNTDPYQEDPYHVPPNNMYPHYNSSHRGMEQSKPYRSTANNGYYPQQNMYSNNYYDNRNPNGLYNQPPPTNHYPPQNQQYSYYDDGANNHMPPSGGYPRAPVSNPPVYPQGPHESAEPLYDYSPYSSSSDTYSQPLTTGYRYNSTGHSHPSYAPPQTAPVPHYPGSQPSHYNRYGLNIEAPEEIAAAVPLRSSSTDAGYQDVPVASYEPTNAYYPNTVHERNPATLQDVHHVAHPVAISTDYVTEFKSNSNEIDPSVTAGVTTIPVSVVGTTTTSTSSIAGNNSLPSSSTGESFRNSVVQESSASAGHGVGYFNSPIVSVQSPMSDLIREEQLTIVNHLLQSPNATLAVTNGSTANYYIPGVYNSSSVVSASDNGTPSTSFNSDVVMVQAVKKNEKLARATSIRSLSNPFRNKLHLIDEKTSMGSSSNDSNCSTATTTATYENDDCAIAPTAANDIDAFVPSETTV